MKIKVWDSDTERLRKARKGELKNIDEIDIGVEDGHFAIREQDGGLLIEFMEQEELGITPTTDHAGIILWKVHEC